MTCPISLQCPQIPLFPKRKACCASTLCACAGSIEPNESSLPRRCAHGTCRGETNDGSSLRAWLGRQLRASDDFSYPTGLFSSLVYELLDINSSLSSGIVEETPKRRRCSAVKLLKPGDQGLSVSLQRYKRARANASVLFERPTTRA